MIEINHKDFLETLLHRDFFYRSGKVKFYKILLPSEFYEVKNMKTEFLNFRHFSSL